MFLRRPPRPKTIRLRTPNQRAGDAAEDTATAHLTAHGLRILARNVRYADGELDIVALDGDTLVFVEVRLRSSDSHGGAFASVDTAKRRRVTRAAQHFLAARARGGARDLPPCRFDVIAADANRVIAWVKDAFTAEE
jgi:putative endonuclease